MSDKIGSDFAREMLDRGRRELGGVLFPDSNVAQPTYLLRGGYAHAKEAAPTMEGPKESVIDERLALVGPSQEDPGKDDRNMDRD